MNDLPASLPALGAAIRHEFLLDPHWLTVNHGSFRATPQLVPAAPADGGRRAADKAPPAVARARAPRTKVVALAHIPSPAAFVLLIERMTAACPAAGAPVLVDGAHGPGQVALALPAMGADWYVGNCHKWLMSAKGCAFLWARPDRQGDLHPVTISHGYGQGFLAEFDWTGTRDASAFLAVDAAIDFHYRLSGPALPAP